MILAGIDFSISCPAITIWDDSTELHPKNCLFFYNQNGVSIKERKRLSELEYRNVYPNSQYTFHDNSFSRVFCLSDWIFSIISEMEVDLVVLEAYSYGSTGLIFNIAEATSLLKMFIHISDISLVTIPPKSAKKSFCGKGNAKKEDMISCFNSRYNYSISECLGMDEDKITPISDIIDSFALIYTYKNNLLEA